ncbi:phosphohydrolase [Caulobacter flavus]|uniref:Phosphohydrolase n=1 Tax=Caulobacter flavus TaxID=1679497 RepID=A0A2N5D356_9CAUL|nr:phosphohydrolase [Caulobacter flavus]AYV48927.1 phosphohydrolase [Caulobacter flavus]PLR20495.1 phosphohydrolase [Caulobacter flavus]
MSAYPHPPRAAYREPHRRYHTLAHIEDCLARLAATPGLGDHERGLLEQAIWWHDAVYDPLRPDNEARSADLAREAMAATGVAEADIAEIERLILLTNGHTVEPGDRLGALMVSIDLSILGAEPQAYAAYARAIREEYAAVPEDIYRAGRARVLQTFLAATVLFPDPALAQVLDASARRNLAAEIAELTRAGA